MITQCQLESDKGLQKAMTTRFYIMTVGVVPSEQLLLLIVGFFCTALQFLEELALWTSVFPRGLKMKCNHCSLTILNQLCESSPKAEGWGRRVRHPDEQIMT